MKKFVCIREYTVQEYDALGNKTEVLVAVGDVMDEDNKYLNKKYCHLIK